MVTGQNTVGRKTEGNTFLPHYHKTFSFLKDRTIPYDFTLYVLCNEFQIFNGNFQIDSPFPLSPSNWQDFLK